MSLTRREWLRAMGLHAGCLFKLTGTIKHASLLLSVRLQRRRACTCVRIGARNISYKDGIDKGNVCADNVNVMGAVSASGWMYLNSGLLCRIYFCTNSFLLPFPGYGLNSSLVCLLALFAIRAKRTKKKEKWKMENIIFGLLRVSCDLRILVNVFFFAFIHYNGLPG